MRISLALRPFFGAGSLFIKGRAYDKNGIRTLEKDIVWRQGGNRGSKPEALLPQPGADTELLELVLEHVKHDATPLYISATSLQLRCGSAWKVLRVMYKLRRLLRGGACGVENIRLFTADAEWLMAKLPN